MNSYKFTLFVFLSILPILGHAEWMSDVDKQYQQNDPVLYADVLKAKSLMDDAHGKTALNIQAREILKTVLNKNPKFAPAYVQYARVISRLGYKSNNEYDGAALNAQEDYLKKAIALEPDYDYAIAMMGFTKMFQGDLAEAEKYYNKATKMKSGYPYLKAQIAQLASKRGDYKKAIQIATESYEEHKSEPKIAAGIIGELIGAYRKLEKLEGNHIQDIDYWYEMSITLDPSVAWAWGDYAKFKLFQMGDADSAIQYGEKALSIMNYGFARRVVAGAYYKKWADLKDDKARSVEANEAWNKAQKLYPDTREIIREFFFYPLLKSTAEALFNEEKVKESRVQTP